MPAERLRWLGVMLGFTLLLAACAADAATPTTTGAPPAQPPPTTALPEPTTAPAPTTSSLPDAPSGNLEALTLDVDGLQRDYWLYLPPQLDRTQPTALIVDLHGFSSNPEDHDAATGMRALADVAGFAVAQPGARGAFPTWNPQPGEQGAAADLAFIRAVVADVADRIVLDPGRVYASGFSNGGGMAHRLACDAADLFAAVGTVSGQYPLVESCEPERPVAIISFHGTADLVVPITGVRRVFPDVTQWAVRWADRNGCAPVPARARLTPDVLVDVWAGCDGGVVVEFYTIDAGPHAWPGARGESFFAATQSISASQEMWAFFREHARS